MIWDEKQTMALLGFLLEKVDRKLLKIVLRLTKQD